MSLKQQTWWKLIAYLLTAVCLIAIIFDGIANSINIQDVAVSMTPNISGNVVVNVYTDNNNDNVSIQNEHNTKHIWHYVGNNRKQQHKQRNYGNKNVLNNNNYTVNLHKPLISVTHHHYKFMQHLSDFGLSRIIISKRINNTLYASIDEEHKQFYITCMDAANTTYGISNIISYEQHYNYFLNISSNTFQYLLSENQIGLGLGNLLSIYLGARAMAYWFNYTFQWKICNNYRYDARYASKQLFSSFLSKLINTSKHELTHTHYAYFLYANWVRHETRYIHPSSLLFLYYNRFYRDVLSMEFNHSLKRYYQFNELNKKIELNNIFTNIESDIVIHIRCGDIWIYLGRNRQYGFLTTNYYKYSVINGTQAIFDINWIKDKITKNTTVWILSQLTAKSMRNSDSGAFHDCYYLVHSLINNCFSKLFAPATVKIVDDSDINDDFYRMMNAPLLICSSSSFCLLAAIANKNGYVIMPRFGPWIDLDYITNIDNNYSSDKIAKHSRFLPSNHAIIDNIKTRWFVNRVRDFHEGRGGSHLQKNITMLTQYLLNH